MNSPVFALSLITCKRRLALAHMILSLALRQMAHAGAVDEAEQALRHLLRDGMLVVHLAGEHMPYRHQQPPRSSDVTSTDRRLE
jgi:hypothetical protein